VVRFSGDGENPASRRTPTDGRASFSRLADGRNMRAGRRFPRRSPAPSSAAIDKRASRSARNQASITMPRARRARCSLGVNDDNVSDKQRPVFLS